MAKISYERPDGTRFAFDTGDGKLMREVAEKAARDLWGDTAPKCEKPEAGIESDVVAIYDDAGIPSIMRRFRKVTDKELFGGADKVHPAFVIGGVEYDEIYIGVYEGTEINGRIYSLPYTKPRTKITMDEFAEKCFAKGEGWHMMTAAEWGLVANECGRLGTMPHGNTDGGSWHGGENEKGVFPEGYDEQNDPDIVLTGSGPVTWTHNHKPDGVHDLCGNVWEMLPGLRIMDGVMQVVPNNDAALPGAALADSGQWTPVQGSGGDLRAAYEEGRAVFSTEQRPQSYGGCRWESAEIKGSGPTRQMMELALYAGEPNAYIYVDGTEGEYILYRGGHWISGSYAGVFCSSLDSPRSHVLWAFGGRVAYFKKH